MVDYPPAVPPSTRTDSTTSAVTHAADHNQEAAALTAIITILGAAPQGGYADLTARLTSVDDDAVAKAATYLAAQAPALVAGLLSSDTTIRTAAVNAVTTAVAGLNLVLSTDARIPVAGAAAGLGVIPNEATVPGVVPVVDAARRILSYYDLTTGAFTPARMAYPGGSITPAALNAALAGAIPSALPAESGYIFAFVDLNRRIIFGVRDDLTFTAAKTDFAQYSLRDADSPNYFAHPYRDTTGRYQVDVTKKSSGVRTIRTTSATVDTVEPTFSADGTKLIYRDTSTGVLAGYYRPADGSGQAWPVAASPTAYCVGDSLTEQGYPALLATELGITAINDGIGGQGEPGIAARANGTPAKLAAPVNIPAGVTPVVVTFDVPILNAAGNKTRTGTLNGVPGTLSWDQPTGVYTFTRTTAGSSIPVVANTPFFTDLGLAGSTQTLFIWAGRNSYRLTDNAGVLAPIQSIIDYHKTLLPRFAVLEIPPDATTDLPGSAYRIDLDATNAAMAAQWPDNFVPVAQYLRTTQAFTDLGILPTSQDNTDMANGVTPISLRATGDTLHLNLTYGYLAVAKFLAAFARSKGWYT